jgi:putative restriction endonuclease
MTSALWAEVLAPLESTHRRALEWFLAREGTEIPWPEPLGHKTFLTSKAKGIFKPKWSKYALSVRQTLRGPYPDRPVEHNADGSWSYQYYQESLAPSERDGQFTNRGLLECYRDIVPVAVLIQTRGRPQVRYRVLGLAFVSGWVDGYFILQSAGSSIGQHVAEPSRVDSSKSQPATRADLIGGTFDPSLVEDERRRTLATITARRGQAVFRKQLLEAYRGRCALTGYDAEEALEASHIVPYRGAVTNHPSNGLLLRADLHTLFDLGLLALDEQRLTPLVSEELRSTSYAELIMHGRALFLPELPHLRPSTLALKQHRMWSGL